MARALHYFTAAVALLAVGAFASIAAGENGAASSSGLSVAWKAPLNAVPSGAILNAAGDTVYISADDAFAYAFDAYSGALKWRAVLTAPASCSPVEVPALGLVLVIASDSTVNAIASGNGTVVSTSLSLNDSPFTGCTPVYDANSTFVFASNRQSGSMWAIDPVAMQIPPAWGGSDNGWSTPTLRGDGTLLVGCQDGYVYQYKCADGTSGDFSYSGPASNFNRPANVRGSVLFTSAYAFIDVDFTTGDQTWQTQLQSTNSDVTMGPSGDIAVFGTDYGRVVGVDPFTKSIAWAANLTNGGVPVVTTPALLGDSWIVGDKSGVVYAVSGASAAVTSSLNLTAPAAAFSQPAVSAAFGTAFVAVQGGVYAIATGATPRPSPTPAPATSIVENLCDGAGCTRCREVVIPRNTCEATSVASSAKWSCTATAMVRTTFAASADCTGTGTAESFDIGTCYAQNDGSFLSVVQCPVA